MIVPFLTSDDFFLAIAFLPLFPTLTALAFLPFLTSLLAAAKAPTSEYTLPTCLYTLSGPQTYVKKKEKKAVFAFWVPNGFSRSAHAIGEANPLLNFYFLGSTGSELGQPTMTQLHRESRSRTVVQICKTKHLAMDFVANRQNGKRR
jgi:hypothetical protein